jgi:ribosome-binding protein aMBF1 (putative translation factor)
MECEWCGKECTSLKESGAFMVCDDCYHERAEKVFEVDKK